MSGFDITVNGTPAIGRVVDFHRYALVPALQWEGPRIPLGEVTVVAGDKTVIVDVVEAPVLGSRGTHIGIIMRRA